MAYDFRRDKILGPALEYWQAKCGTRPMPRRCDIDPTEIPRLLPNLQITELINNGARIRCRLVGTAIVEAHGTNFVGKYFDELFSGRRLDFINANYRMVRGERRPVFVCNPYVGAWNIELICTRLIMPLSEDGEIVTQCLTAMNFYFHGVAPEWPSEWFENRGYVDVANTYDIANSYSEIVR